MDKQWAQAPAPRHQQVLFAETLDEVVPPDHTIRRLDAILLGLDWSAWEARYDGHRGQPPLHPRLVAGSILYGLLRKVQSSRDLESATRERLDFRWFLEGRTIDHATFAGFRSRFEPELKDLFGQIARLICRTHEEALVALVIDGTRIRANSDRHGARTAQWLEQQVARCIQALKERLARLGQADDPPVAADEEVERLHAEVARLQGQVTQYERALEQARIRDGAKQAKEGKGALPVRVPVTDPDSMIVPNKEGGFAPNYTPTVAVDVATGMIVSADVLKGSEECTAVLPAIAQAEAIAGKAPQRILADSGFASGENLQALEACGIDAYMPTDADFRPENPANREDPTQPVPEAQRQDLPRRGGKVGRAAFVYDTQADEYRCPMGAALLPVRKERSGTRYQCPGKAGCPMADQCVRGESPVRMVVRDPYQDQRETVGRRMATPEGRAVYKKRAPVVEGTFANLKHGMGIRRFLMRGLAKVRMEWDWICASYNLKRLMVLHVNPSAGKPKNMAIETARIARRGQHGCPPRSKDIIDVLNGLIRRFAWNRVAMRPVVPWVA